MIASETLFQIEPKYCIDTNVIVSFLSESDDEYYGADIFPDHWQQIATMIASGRIVAPRQVENELNGHAKKRPKIGPWQTPTDTCSGTSRQTPSWSSPSR
jgi:hypothetical protein